jgi:predicted nuclease of restriction endonuclease-like (RecB) superfamily
MKYAQLVKAIDAASQQLLGRAAAVVNQALVIRNWLIGAYTVEFEQNGQDRAKYGTRLLDRLAEDLKRRGLKGLDARTLRDCRTLYFLYPQIRGALSPESAEQVLARPVRLLPAAQSQASAPGRPIRGPMDPELANRALSHGEMALAVLDPRRVSPLVVPPEIRGPVDPETGRRGPTPLSADLALRFSWSKLLQFLRIADPWKRAFYENECLKGNWSKRQLQRQIGSLLYERTGLSTNKEAVLKRARRQEPQETIQDLIRDPYILEFTGLGELPRYTESDLETALLDHLQKFLLELGTGFCFEARQFRVTLGNEHDYVDLVFYQRRLRCHVLLDLKVRPFKHADAGQMNYYLNYFKARMMADGDQPPVGILLCSDKDQTKVQFATAGMDTRSPRLRR